MMAMIGRGTHHHHLAVELEDLELAGRNDEHAIARITTACEEHVRHRSDFAHDEREEVVSAALADVWALIHDRHDPRHVHHKLRQAIEFHVRREQRRRERFVTGIDIDALRHYERHLGDAPTNDFEVLDHAFGVVRSIFALVPHALAKLNDADHDLIVHFYGLQTLGSPARHAHEPTFRTRAAGHRALRRARRRFTHVLEHLIRDRLASGHGDAVVLHDALRFLRDGLPEASFAHHEHELLLELAV